jgi:histidine triad (HIT) family protein
LASPPDDCLFCGLAREGPHVATTEGFVAIRDINPAAPVHLLIIPVRHLDSFREVALLDADESKRMLDFLAETARGQGLSDYRVVANVGAGAGQTVFHLHWHLLGDPDHGSLLGAETP